jgi:hypothetical protein
MDCSIFAVADFASVSEGGKLNIMGVFDNINALEFPCTHPLVSVAAQLRGGARDYNRQHNLEIRLVDEDGQDMIPPFQTTLQVHRPPNGESVVMPLVLNLQQLVFPKPGHYEFVLNINDTCIGSKSIQCIKAAPHVN